MNDLVLTGRSMLIGSALAVLVTIRPVVWLNFEPSTTTSFEIGAALTGAALGWLFATLG